MPMMRAEPWASLVTIGICQPCHERAGMPMDCSTMASRPAVMFSPEATTASYSRASCRSDASRTQATSWFVAPDMAETTTATLLPASTSRLTCWATMRMRSTLATEVPPNFITRVVIEPSCESAPKPLRPECPWRSKVPGVAAQGRTAS